MVAVVLVRTDAVLKVWYVVVSLAEVVVPVALVVELVVLVASNIRSVLYGFPFHCPYL